MTYKLNGMSPADVSYPGGITNKPGSTAWAGGGESQSVDKERYAQLDGDLRISEGVWDSVNSAPASPTTNAVPSIRLKPVRARWASATRARPGTARCIRATSPPTSAATCPPTTSSTTAQRWAPGGGSGNRLFD
jgi:hypothetical protein